MKALLPIIVMFIWTSSLTAVDAGDTAVLYEHADKLYHEAESPADYLVAAKTYREILKRGEISAATLNDLGNAWLKSGRTGPAIIAYERALRYDPGNPAIVANLDYAKHASSAIYPAENTPVLDIIFFWTRFMTPQHIAWVAAGLVALSVVIAMLQLFSVRVPLARTSIIVAMFIAVLMFFSAFRLNAEYNRERGVTTAARTDVFSNDSPDSEPVFSKPVSEGTLFDVLSHRGSWTLVRIPTASGPVEGWIPNTDVMIYSEKQTDFIGE